MRFIGLYQHLEQGLLDFEVREISFAEVFQGMSSDLKKEDYGKNK